MMRSLGALSVFALALALGACSGDDDDAGAGGGGTAGGAGGVGGGSTGAGGSQGGSGGQGGGGPGGSGGQGGSPGPSAKRLVAEGLGGVHNFAVTEGALYAVLVVGRAQVVRCPLGGCDVGLVATIKGDLPPTSVAIAANDRYVFWTETEDRIMRASADGTGAGQHFYHPGERIDQDMAVVDDEVYYAASGGVSESVVRALDVETPSYRTLEATRGVPVLSRALDVAGGRLATFQNRQPPEETPVLVLDLASGAAVPTGAKAAYFLPFTLAVSGDALSWVSSGTGDQKKAYVCRGACETPAELPASALPRVALGNGRVYFTAAAAGVASLVSCPIDEAAAGACANPTVHASGVEWANVRKLVVTSTTAYGMSVSPNSLFAAAL